MPDFERGDATKALQFEVFPRPAVDPRPNWNGGNGKYNRWKKDRVQVKAVVPSLPEKESYTSPKRAPKPVLTQAKDIVRLSEKEMTTCEHKLIARIPQVGKWKQICSKCGKNFE